MELGVAIVIAVLVWRSGHPLVYTLAGHAPPLGIALRADGFSAVMLVTAGLIAPAAGLFARTNFATPQGTEKRAPLVFWTLLQGVQAGLSLLFLGGDLFNLYVGLELLTFAAVPLVCLDGRPRRSQRRCAIFCSRCSARCSIFWVWPCSTGPMAHSISSSSPSVSEPNPLYG